MEQKVFIEFRSAFNTIIPSGPVTTLSDLGFSQQICLWIKNLFTDRAQRVRVGLHLSLALSISSGSPLDCVLTTLLFTLYTIIKFMDDVLIPDLLSPPTGSFWNG